MNKMIRTMPSVFSLLYLTILFLSGMTPNHQKTYLAEIRQLFNNFILIGYDSPCLLTKDS